MALQVYHIQRIIERIWDFAGPPPRGSLLHEQGLYILLRGLDSGAEWQRRGAGGWGHWGKKIAGPTRLADINKEGHSCEGKTVADPLVESYSLFAHVRNATMMLSLAHLSRRVGPTLARRYATPTKQPNPQLNGYPELPDVSAQYRPPLGWQDQLLRRNFGDTVRLKPRWRFSVLSRAAPSARRSQLNVGPRHPRHTAPTSSPSVPHRSRVLCGSRSVHTLVPRPRTTRNTARVPFRWARG